MRCRDILIAPSLAHGICALMLQATTIAIWHAVNVRCSPKDERLKLRPRARLSQRRLVSQMLNGTPTQH